MILNQRVVKKATFLAVILLFLSAFIKFVYPVFIEERKGDLDKIREHDLNILEQFYKTDKTNQLVSSNVVYISLPSDKSDCSDFLLPTLPKSMIYHCANFDNYKHVDGTGWMPLKLENINELPVDPENSINNYYAFVVVNNKFALYDSEKSPVMKFKDESNYSVLMSQNSSYSVYTNTLGLISYLPFSESKDDSSTIDQINPDINIDIPQNNMLYKFGCIFGTCIHNISNDKVAVNIPARFTVDNTSNFSYSLLFKIEKIPEKNFQLYNPGLDRLDVNVEGKSGSIFIWYKNSIQKGLLVYKSNPQKYIDGKWHLLTITRGIDSIKVYIDDSRVSKVSIDPQDKIVNINKSFITLDNEVSIDSLKVFNRELQDYEIFDDYHDSIAE